MSGIFSKPKMPDILKQTSQVSDMKMVQEDADVAQRREKKRLLARSGRRSTIISGIQSALKKRLGE